MDCRPSPIAQAGIADPMSDVPCRLLSRICPRRCRASAMPATAQMRRRHKNRPLPRQKIHAARLGLCRRATCGRLQPRRWAIRGATHSADIASMQYAQKEKPLLVESPLCPCFVLYCILQQCGVCFFAPEMMWLRGRDWRTIFQPGICTRARKQARRAKLIPNNKACACAFR